MLVDSAGWLYVFEDSATAVKVYKDAASWSGAISAEPDLEILGAINRGYGVAVAELLAQAATGTSQVKLQERQVGVRSTHQVEGSSAVMTARA